MHTIIHIGLQRYTYILAYMHEFIHKSKPSHYPIDHRKWENAIHLFIPDISISASFKLTASQRRSRPQQLTLCRSLHVEGLQTCPRSLAWRLEKDSNPRPSG